METTRYHRYCRQSHHCDRQTHSPECYSLWPVWHQEEDPEFFAAYIMNYVLGGGGFESRLYREVREKRGLHTLSILTFPRINILGSLWVGLQLPTPGQTRPLKS